VKVTDDRNFLFTIYINLQRQYQIDILSLIVWPGNEGCEDVYKVEQCKDLNCISRVSSSFGYQLESNPTEVTIAARPTLTITATSESIQHDLYFQISSADTDDKYMITGKLIIEII
jgi:hypothetical protein